MLQQQRALDALPEHQHRSLLARTLCKLREGQLTIGFLGGSITDPRVLHSWPEPVIAWFVHHFPDARIIVENAAIGATGSELAVFRAQREIIDRNCDLVFIEYAVNDNGQPTEKRNRTREGLIRKLLAGEGRDIVFAYTFCQDMYADMMAGQVPSSIAEFEAIAGHYGIGSAWMGLRALREVCDGFMRWEVWLPDGIHPHTQGSQAYGRSVIGFLEHELLEQREAPAIRTGDNMPPPLNPNNWENACLLPFSAVTTQGPWAIHRWPLCIGVEQVLSTSAPGSTMALEFDGRGICLAFDFGQTSGEFCYRIDGGEWITECRERFEWVGESGWLRVSPLAEDMPSGKHQLELEVLNGGPTCKGASFRLALIGVVP